MPATTGKIVLIDFFVCSVRSSWPCYPAFLFHSKDYDFIRESGFLDDAQELFIHVILAFLDTLHLSSRLHRNKKKSKTDPFQVRKANKVYMSFVRRANV